MKRIGHIDVSFPTVILSLRARSLALYLSGHAQHVFNLHISQSFAVLSPRVKKTFLRKPQFPLKSRIYSLAWFFIFISG